MTIVTSGMSFNSQIPTNSFNTVDAQAIKRMRGIRITNDLEVANIIPRTVWACGFYLNCLSHLMPSIIRFDAASTVPGKRI